MKYELTIFITTFERPKYLEECLNNLSNQSYQKFKVIILDNSENINYLNLLNQNFTFDIKYKKNKRNIGSVKNLFQAFSWNMDTEYFMIFHDDDLMHKNYLELSMKILKENQKIAWVGCNLSKNNLDHDKKIKLNFKLYNKHELINNILSGINFTYSSIIYNKKNINLLNLDDYLKKYSIIHDRPLIINFIKKNNLAAIINNKLVYYRIHDEQDSKTGSLNISIDNQFNLYKFYKDNLDKNIITFFRYNIFVCNNIIGDFFNLNNQDKISLIDYLRKAKKENVINYSFPIFYLVSKIYFLIKKIIYKIID